MTASCQKTRACGRVGIAFACQEVGSIPVNERK